MLLSRQALGKVALRAYQLCQLSNFHWLAKPALAENQKREQESALVHGCLLPGFHHPSVDFHMIQVPQDDDDTLAFPDEILHTQAESFDLSNIGSLNADMQTESGTSHFSAAPLKETLEADLATRNSESEVKNHVATAIAQRRNDLATSACPMLCALRLLRFVSWILQDRSGAIDFQLCGCRRASYH